MRYVRGSKRTWRPRKTKLPDEDWLYDGVPERPDKQQPDLSPNMLKVYHSLTAGMEHTVADLRNRTGLTKGQVENALNGLHYRYLVDRVQSGGCNWWIIR